MNIVGLPVTKAGPPKPYDVRSLSLKVIIIVTLTCLILESGVYGAHHQYFRPRGPQPTRAAPQMRPTLCHGTSYLGLIHHLERTLLWDVPRYWHGGENRGVTGIWVQHCPHLERSDGIRNANNAFRS